MNREDRDQLITRFLEAWNSQDVQRVLDCYTDDVRYRDPSTRGEVAFLWHATLRHGGQRDAVEIDGMDFVVLRGDRVARNEVYFDRSLLASAVRH